MISPRCGIYAGTQRVQVHANILVTAIVMPGKACGDTASAVVVKGERAVGYLDEEQEHGHYGVDADGLVGGSDSVRHRHDEHGERIQSSRQQ
jgi:hypothetical protein